MSYEAVKKLAENQPVISSGVDWMKVVTGCYKEAKSHGDNRFAGTWVYRRQATGWFPGLSLLEKYGILIKVASVSAGAYYVMPDIEGVGRALRDLGYLQKHE